MTDKKVVRTGMPSGAILKGKDYEVHVAADIEAVGCMLSLRLTSATGRRRLQRVIHALQRIHDQAEVAWEWKSHT